jgi:hypothetical protein
MKFVMLTDAKVDERVIIIKLCALQGTVMSFGLSLQALTIRGSHLLAGSSLGRLSWPLKQWRVPSANLSPTP